jgi:hypothetical protein
VLDPRIQQVYDELRNDRATWLDVLFWYALGILTVVGYLLVTS